MAIPGPFLFFRNDFTTGIIYREERKEVAKGATKCIKIDLFVKADQFISLIVSSRT
jgi:hypothetical protein